MRYLNGYLIAQSVSVLQQSKSHLKICKLDLTYFNLFDTIGVSGLP